VVLPTVHTLVINAETELVIPSCVNVKVIIIPRLYVLVARYLDTIDSVKHSLVHVALRAPSCDDVKGVLSLSSNPSTGNLFR
jgi:hypothetical protein